MEYTNEDLQKMMRESATARRAYVLWSMGADGRADRAARKAGIGAAGFSLTVERDRLMGLCRVGERYEDDRLVLMGALNLARDRAGLPVLSVTRLNQVIAALGRKVTRRDGIVYVDGLRLIGGEREKRDALRGY